MGLVSGCGRSIKDHVWSYDSMIDHTADGRTFKIVNIIDEYARERLAILAACKTKNRDIIDILFNLFSRQYCNSTGKILPAFLCYARRYLE
jgi:aspartate carbamoyltransferase regulatory subunit